ncbi:MAG: hypothetical protein DHS20C15_01570 [Planctomycetota bacterium]|nr:MAG: hypothetical protein DHS20C15_01570 [Planctomycetota bacterium]
MRMPGAASNALIWRTGGEARRPGFGAVRVGAGWLGELVGSPGAGDQVRSSTDSRLNIVAAKNRAAIVSSKVLTIVIT